MNAEDTIILQKENALRNMGLIPVLFPILTLICIVLFIISSKNIASTWIISFVMSLSFVFTLFFYKIPNVNKQFNQEVSFDVQNNQIIFKDESIDIKNIAKINFYIVITQRNLQIEPFCFELICNDNSKKYFLLDGIKKKDFENKYLLPNNIKLEHQFYKSPIFQFLSLFVILNLILTFIF